MKQSIAKLATAYFVGSNMTIVGSQKPEGHGVISYIDRLASIGSCVMQMLLTKNASIIAFEPRPADQYYVLMSTKLEMSKEYQDRFLLFPIALGAQQANSPIHAAKGDISGWNGNQGQ
jgi:hypothetical protein